MMTTLKTDPMVNEQLDDVFEGANRVTHGDGEEEGHIENEQVVMLANIKLHIIQWKGKKH